jgi:Dolichyl-phosphate-mannose--protein O-mannosyl transferase
MKKKVNPKKKTIHFQLSDRILKLTRTEILWVVIITVVYAAIALYDLGSSRTPATGWIFQKQGDSITLDLGKAKAIGYIEYYLGPYEQRNFKLELANSLDDGFKKVTDNMLMKDALKWDKTRIYKAGRYIRLTSLNNEASIYEVILRDTDGKPILPVNAQKYPQLFDEQEYSKKDYSYLEDAYFDEYLYAGTAYEFLHGLTVSEWTHPPLGKLIILAGIQIFGNHPFGWRIMGILFGIAMIPIFYLLARRLFKEIWIAIITTILFTFDFMHFTQTRVGTIDVFVVFFLLLMYYFMLCYMKMSFYDTNFKKTLVPLGCCGIFMGFAVACKWTGVFGGAGLAILFIWQMRRRYQEYCFAKNNPGGKTKGIFHDEIVNNFSSYFWKTIIFCAVFFVVIPSIIYILSYIPFAKCKHQGLLYTVWQNQKNMLNYHSRWVINHPYASRWYQWPVIAKPMLYYVKNYGNGLSAGISAFGNPLVWWAGIPAFFYMEWLRERFHDNCAAFLEIGYLAQYIPWIFISRTTYIYHYFASVPFVTLMIGYAMYTLTKKDSKGKKLCYVYTGAAVILFILFYPVLSGHPVSNSYVSCCLQWFSSWVLTL